VKYRSFQGCPTEVHNSFNLVTKTIQLELGYRLLAPLKRIQISIKQQELILAVLNLEGHYWKISHSSSYIHKTGMFYTLKSKTYKPEVFGPLSDLYHMIHNYVHAFTLVRC